MASKAGVPPEPGQVKETAPGGIVVGVDGSRLSYSAFNAGVRLRRPGEFLTVLHIALPAAVEKTRPSFESAAFIEAEFLYKGSHNGIPEGEYQVLIIRCGADEGVDQALCRTLKKLKAGLFICGAFGRNGPSPFSKGNKTDLSLRECTCSTLIVKPETRVPSSKRGCTFLAGVDGVQNLTGAIVDTVLARAKKRDKIVLLHISVGEEDEQLPKVVEEAIKRMDAADVEYQFLNVVKEPRKTLAQHIAETAQRVEAHMTVVGVDHMMEYKMKKKFLGSVTDSVVKKTRTSVLLVKSTFRFDTIPIPDGHGGV